MSVMDFYYSEFWVTVMHSIFKKYKTDKIHMVIYEPFNAAILIIQADVSASMHDLNLLWPLTQY